MAPIKLEDHIKERLEDRKIAPTPAAWDRIATNLDTNASKKQDRKRLWFAIAASFIGGLFIASLFFKPAKEVLPRLEVVDGQEYKQPNDNSTASQTQTDAYDELDDTKNESESIKLQQPNAIVLEEIQDNNKSTRTQHTIKRVVEQELKLTSITQSTLAIIDHNDTITSLVAIEQELKAQNDSYVVTDAEVDKLLKQAQEELFKEKQFTKKTSIVDANELLLDAEAEADPDTFKDRIFKTIKSGLEEVVEAVVDKDN